MSRTRKIRVLSRMSNATRLIGAKLAGVVLLGSLALAGCSQTDPFERSGTWKPFGANDANIATMAANPADLSRGQAVPTINNRTSAGAVTRLWQGPPPAGPNAAANAPAAAPPGGAPGGPQAPR